MDTQIGNAAIASGSIGPTLEKILEAQKPEAIYFYEENGVRTQMMVLNMDDASQMPSIAEPWWQAFGGTVNFYPAMTAEDLQKGMHEMQD